MSNLYFNKYFRLIVFIIVSLIICGSFYYLFRELSFDFDKSKGGSYINWSTFSQFFAAFGTLFAVIIAIFQENIKLFLNPTTAILLDNLGNDSYFENHNENGIWFYRYFVHLRIINTNKNQVLKNCSLNLEPQDIYGDKIDIPRPFIYAGKKYTENDVYIEDYFDFIVFDLHYKHNQIDNHFSLYSILRIDNYRTIKTGLTNKNQINLPVSISSSSLTQKLYYDVNIEFDIANMKTVNNPGVEISDFYKFVKIKITKTKN